MNITVERQMSNGQVIDGVLKINGKKVCGILTEAGSDFQNNKLKYAVCGIGINCYGLDFPLEISNIATSLEKEGAKVFVTNPKELLNIIP